MSRFLFCTLVCLTASLPLFVGAAVRSSGSYGLQSDSLNFAGGLGVSASYKNESTLGEVATGKSGSGNYALADAGYQQSFVFAPDHIAPSAPTTASATLLTTSSIEVTWSGSTDNVAVSGYYIYRDGARVASVANFPFDYVDNGLIPNTVYAYNISAFDASGNESAWSATTSARTLTPTPTTEPPTGGGSIGSSQPGVVTTGPISVVPNDTSAVITFATNLEASAEISWGPDDTYSQGSAADASLSTQHAFVIKGLKPQTTYFVRVKISRNGRTTVYDRIQFKTTVSTIVSLPPNALAFAATADQAAIHLSWKLPVDPSLVRVKVVRSSTFYPSSPADGRVVYNDSVYANKGAADAQVVSGVTYYYTLFTEDVAGNFSSGAVSAARILKSGEAAATTTPLDTLPTSSNVDPKIAALTFSDFLFLQHGTAVAEQDQHVQISGNENLTLALSAFRLPDVLKTIAVTLVTTDTPHKSFTFILRPNKDHTRFESTIGALGTTTTYTIKINVIDFKNQGLKKIEGALSVTGQMMISLSSSNSAKRSYLWVLVPLLIFFCVAAFLMRYFHRHV